MYLTGTARVTALRKDIREDLRRAAEGPGRGGDFHVPFWTAAKAHARNLGSGLINHSQKMTAAAMQIAEKKVWAQRS
jgi:hypothetical protein